MTICFAFAGFRHAHIFGLIKDVNAWPDASIVAMCEEDPATRGELNEKAKIALTHDSYDRMLAETECDVVALGDYYAKRGELALKALQAGKHVISDKPLCTSLEQLDQIEQLTQEKNLQVGLQLDVRNDGAIRTMRSLIRAGKIGPVHTVTFTGQHPLNLGVRPQWYFEPGCHGGTINDIAIHAIDLVGWITGRRITEVVAARAWNARVKDYPHFRDGAQFMLRLDNNGSVLSDVSYLAPENCAGTPGYWRFTFHGEQGMVEGSYGTDSVILARKDAGHAEQISAEPNVPMAYLTGFLAALRGQGIPKDALTTADCLSSTRTCLEIQKMADATG